MSDKFTQQDLADLLAQRHEMEQADAEAFVKTLFALIEESIETDKYVKIKGLGTFKLIDVDARESIDVNTGERIEIQGHSRISFTPDSWMRETVNKPFEHFETVLLNEGTRFDDMDEVSSLDEDADASEEEIGEGVSLPDANSNSEIEEAKEEKANQEKLVPEEADGNKAVPDSPQKEPDSETTEPVSEKAEKPEDETAEPVLKVPESIHEDLEPAVGKKIFRFPWCMVATVLLVGVILGGIIVWSIFSGRRYIPESVVHMLMEKETVPLNKDTVGIRSDLEKDSILPVKQIPAVQQDTVREVVAQVKPDEEKQQLPTVVKRETLADTVEYMITGTRSTYTIKSGESLVRVALKFYGNKKLWPYLVQYNKDIIKDADVVPVGTTIRIPELTPKEMNRK